MGRSSKKPEKSRKNGTKRILIRSRGSSSRASVQQEIGRYLHAGNMENPQTDFVCGFFYWMDCDILKLNLEGMEELVMPEISLFYGIRVTMYYDDHNPPHFHAEYTWK